MLHRSVLVILIVISRNAIWHNATCLPIPSKFPVSTRVLAFAEKLAAYDVFRLMIEPSLTKGSITDARKI